MTARFSFDQAREIAQKNRLRQFPSESKGRARLLPYARPQVTCPPLPENPAFFALGACFGRHLERELIGMGLRVLSSPTGTGLPGSLTEQFQRYNIFNLDVGLNELRWALDGDETARQAALLPLGNDLADTQISWTFAHDPDTAQQFRAIYNASYARVIDADVVFILTGGIEQWFDRQEGIYINSMPGPVANRDFPDRFELHRIDTAAARRTIEGIIALVRRHSRRKPHFILAVSPVSQPMIFGPGDALIDQFYAKVVQRQAVEEVLNSDPGCSYLPALETAIWSDFSYDYMPSSPNHTSANFAARVLSDLLEAGGMDGLIIREQKARAHGAALLAGGDTAAALALCEEAMEAGSVGNLDLDRLYIRALTAARHRDRAFRHALDRAVAGHNVAAMLNDAVNLGRGLATAEDKQLLRQAACDHDCPAEAIDMMGPDLDEAATARMRFRDITQVMAAQDHVTTIRLANELLDDRPDLSPREMARLYQMLIRALVATNSPEDAVRIGMVVATTPDIAREPIAFGAIDGMLRKYATLDQLQEALDALRDIAPAEKIASFERTILRRKEKA